MQNEIITKLTAITIYGESTKKAVDLKWQFFVGFQIQTMFLSLAFCMNVFAVCWSLHIHVVLV